MTVSFCWALNTDKQNTFWQFFLQFYSLSLSLSLSLFQAELWHTHSQRHLPSYFSSFLSVLALGPILRVYSCLGLGPETGRPGCNMCWFSKLLLFSFFFCNDGSDWLTKRASYSCCNFLCAVLAAAYFKYRRCRLSCLSFVWHFFCIVTHTHMRAHAHAYVRQVFCCCTIFLFALCLVLLTYIDCVACACHLSDTFFSQWHTYMRMHGLYPSWVVS